MRVREEEIAPLDIERKINCPQNRERERGIKAEKERRRSDRESTLT